ncbi:MAG: sulfotransferase family protein [Gammaproteobacteria bacterium]
MTHIPDFFIIGAPKAGTTALSEYLAEHRGVFITNPKEPQYFTFDFPGHRGVSTWEEYSALFSHVDVDTKLVGDASVWYLYSHIAIREIHRLQPTAKLIALLRRPDEMIVSLYAQQRQTGIETAGDIETAWRLEPERRMGNSIPMGCRTPEFLYYSAVARYGEQLERVYQLYPREQVKVFLYEDLCADPRAVYVDSLQFLGLEPGDKSDFPVVNPYADVYSPQLQTTLTWFLGHARSINRSVRRRFGFDLRSIRFHRPVIETLQKLNLRPSVPKPYLSETLKREIIEAYREDIDHLMQLLGRDLSAWLI